MKGVGKILMGVIYMALVISCSNYKSNEPDDVKTDTTLSIKSSDTLKKKKISVIVLPPYDEIANAGISPDLRQMIMAAVDIDSSFIDINFDSQVLTKFNMIYEKKYLRELAHTNIIENINPDIIVYTKLNLHTRTGSIKTDTWDIDVNSYLPAHDTSFSIYRRRNIRDWEAIQQDIIFSIDREKMKSLARR